MSAFGYSLDDLGVWLEGMKCLFCFHVSPVWFIIFGDVSVFTLARGLMEGKFVYSHCWLMGLQFHRSKMRAARRLLGDAPDDYKPRSCEKLGPRKTFPRCQPSGRRDG